MYTEVRRSDFGKYVPQKVREDKVIQSDGTDYGEVMDLFKEYSRREESGNIDGLSAEIKERITGIYNPFEIFSFNEVLSNFARPRSVTNAAVINALLRNSYHAGHNNFELDVSEFPSGSTQEIGNSEWVTEEDVDKYGRFCLTFKGDCLDEVVRCSSFAEYTFDGSVPYGLGYESRNTIFRTDNQEALKHLKASVKSAAIYINVGVLDPHNKIYFGEVLVGGYLK